MRVVELQLPAQRDTADKVQGNMRVDGPTHSQTQGQDVLFWFHGRGRENSFANFEVRKLVVILGTNSIVRDYLLVEQPVRGVDSPRTLH